MSKQLDVYLNNECAGLLTQRLQGQLSFQYHKQYVTHHGLAISISLPIQLEAFDDERVDAFFSGLLPDENARYRLARILGLSEKNSFGLLEAIGGECAGALALYTHGTRLPLPENDVFEILDKQKLPEIITLLKRKPLLAGDDGLRLSLAGAQNKLPIRYSDNNIILVKGSSPTTHILKPQIEYIEDSVFNEYFCMRLAKTVNIDVPNVAVKKTRDISCFIIERYDRIIKNNTLQRIHQEDFCQAMGLSPNIKYQREGGPSITDCLNIIETYSIKPLADANKFLKRVIFNYLIGNADAHGKNFSLLYINNKPILAPAYDLLSTAIYPEVTDKMAMKISGKYKPRELALRHWLRLVADNKIARSNFKKLLQTLAHSILPKAQALQETLNQEQTASPVYDKIIKVIEARSSEMIKLLDRGELT